MFGQLSTKQPWRPRRREIQLLTSVKVSCLANILSPLWKNNNSGYNPPQFVLSAAKEVLNRVDCNQYSPTQGRLRLRQALSDAYSPFFGRKLDPATEIVITTGANEGILSALMAFIEEGDEVIVMEPFFDQYIPNIRMAGGKVVYVPLHPPAKGDTEVSSSDDWTLDLAGFERAITEKTRMVSVGLYPVLQYCDPKRWGLMIIRHNPIGKVFSREELMAIGELCVKHNILILSDEVYDRLYYVPFTRIATLSPEIRDLTITAGSAGKNFYCTGWRVGWLIGRPELIKYAGAAHTRICYSSVSPLQEAVAIGLEQADREGFWESSRNEMKAKMDRFNEVWNELGLPFTDPEGGYFVLVNMSKVKMPESYEFPPHVSSRARDFQLSWFLIKEIGVAAIPPTEFYTKANEKEAENYLRFAVCKDDDILEAAKEKLRKLKNYM
ncbi:PLP-dependent transferase [Tuber magnatum]|uniref:PLP-dependent transferase n=1 Tax=Tuber magnatum TaxID=42249 RepID=A0A317SF21_9PEZI|nr:PLP-dependent transferase [Tuber magnatum]